MAINKHLSDFLKDKVNINQSRLDVAKANISGVSSTISGSEDFSKIVIGSPSPQGSYRHGTIIRPSFEGRGFDVDLLVEIKKPDDWSYSDCLEKLFAVFKSHGVYGDKCHMKTRCVTIDYAGQNSVDIVPTFQENGEYYIINRVTGGKEISDGEGFSSWFDVQNRKTNGNLKKVLRLVKFARDNNSIFDIKSIHLNVLFGKAVDMGGDFSNIETTFSALAKRLSEYLSSIHSTSSLNLINPANPKEDLGKGNRNLSDHELAKFKAFISGVSSVLNGNGSAEEKLLGLSEYFGADIGKSYFTEISDQFPYKGHDIVSGLSLYGISLIGNVFIKNPTYQTVSSHGAEHTAELFSGKPVGKRKDLHFECEVRGVGGDYEIFWQVVNSGEEALTAKALRGDFFKGRKKKFERLSIKETPFGPENKNVETTKYAGLHYVRCYVVKDRYLVAQSDRFFVNIK